MTSRCDDVLLLPSKMEGNRDESDRCIGLAEKFINDGQRDKASKYLQKAERLFPSQRAKDLLDMLSKLNGTASANDFSSANQNGDVKSNLKKRNVSGGADKESASTTTTEIKIEYSSEQLEAVKRVKKCKDYYEILGLTKDATDNDLKKQYRKLALQFHPDKNKAPGATEAFKAIGNAFGTLSDPEKRKRYDKYGADEEQRSRSAQHRTNSYEYDYTRGFEAEMTAEELFNMFFGGSTFNSGNVYMRRGNRWAQHRERHQNHHTPDQREQTSYSALLQLLPILILVALSLTSTFFVSEPPYSLQKTQKFMIERSSQNLRIPYFVKETFIKDYENNIQRLEQQIEDEYINGLRQACFREMNYKESLLWRARSFGDRELTAKANSMKMPSCDSFRKLQERNFS